MKVCSRCRKEKPLAEFSNKSSTSDGKDYHCKLCVKKYHIKNKERIAAYQVQYHKDNKKRRCETSKRWRENNPHKVHENTSRRCKYIKDRKPLWADDEAIKRIYKLARAWEKRLGVELHVDHQIPLISNTVCGLHCEANLEILTKKENLTKGNKYEH